MGAWCNRCGEEIWGVGDCPNCKPGNNRSKQAEASSGESLPSSPDSAADVESEVCEDIKRRQKLGVAKYGTTVAANPLSQREWLQHAYEEALDLAIYLKRTIAGTQPPNEKLSGGCERKKL